MQKKQLSLVVLIISILAITVLSGCVSKEKTMQSTNFLSYESSDFKIKYPADWEKNEEIGSVLVTFSVSKNEANPEFVSVSTKSFSGQAPILIDYADFRINQTKKYITDGNIHESGKTTLANNPAYKWVYTVGLGEYDRKIMCTWIIKKNKIYTILYSANVDNFPYYLGIAQEMINSFEFISP